jgi:hypothetical protein
MASVNVPDRMNELNGGTGGSVDPVTGAAIGPYRKSWLKHPLDCPCWSFSAAFAATLKMPALLRRSRASRPTPEPSGAL